MKRLRNAFIGVSFGICLLLAGCGSFFAASDSSEKNNKKESAASADALPQAGEALQNDLSAQTYESLRRDVLYGYLRPEEEIQTHSPLPASDDRTDYCLSYTLPDLSDENTEKDFFEISLFESVSYKNDTGDSLFELVFRDYPAVWASFCDVDVTTDYKDVTDERDGSILSWSRDEKDLSLITIPLDKPLKDGEQITLSFTYTFPVCDIELSENRLNFKKHADGTITIALGSSYPILDYYDTKTGWNRSDSSYCEDGEIFLSELSDYSVEVALPEDRPDMIAVATGSEEEKDTEDGRRVFMTANSVRDFALVLSDSYEMLEDQVCGVSLRSYYYKGEESFGETILFSARLALQAYTEYFGPYPYDSLDLCESALFSGGVEYPQCVMIADDLNGSFDDHEEDKVLWYAYDRIYSGLGLIVAHEVAHNWFYAVVGNDEFETPWLDEGVTTFLEEGIYPVYAGETIPFIWEDVGHNADLYEELFEDKEDSFIDKNVAECGGDYYLYSYYGTYVFLVRLHDALGEEVFHEMLSSFYQDNYMKIADKKAFYDALRPYVQNNTKADQVCRTYLSDW